MSLTVRTMKEHNPGLQGCTTTYLREDHEIVTCRELKTSAATRSTFYLLQKLSVTPSLILETNAFLIASAGGVGAGLLAGIVKGVFQAKNNPRETYTKEWYDWATEWAALNPCARGIQAAIEIIGSSGNVVASIVWQDKTLACGNGAFIGLSLGYNMGCFATHYAFECIHKHNATLPDDEESLIDNHEEA